MKNGERETGTLEFILNSPFPVPHSEFALSSSLCLCVSVVHPVLAVDLFPRGPGYYFSFVKLLAVLCVYLAWVRTCWWVHEDARQLELAENTWNPLMLAGGVAGLLAVWIIPVFWISFPFLVILWLAPTLAYVGTRNEVVDASDRVLTRRHLRQLLRGAFRPKPAARQEETKAVPTAPIRFISRSHGGRLESSRVARAEESRGYQAALNLVYEAIQRRATDIHLEPTTDEMVVRLRIDGMLQAMPSLPRAIGDPIINIFKVLADLDITEKRKAQDGSFSAEVRNDPPSGAATRKKSAADLEIVPATRQIDFRLATAGSVAGEKMVMRILDRTSQVAGLAELGMRERIREQILRVVGQPHGMFIVCGPTGAGKSTTLYACLDEIDRFQRNIITVENPVEYHIEGVTQIEVNPRTGKTFATELRSILRQDPDVIYIGEIRDQETAEIACQAAQTGHMVLTTLHANDTVTALGRLLDLGVQPFMVASAISAILGQRLVRVLCPKCKERYRPDPEVLRRANLPADKIKFFFRAPDNTEEDGKKSCPHCGGSGYRGRTGIFELLAVTNPMRELIRANPNFNAIRQEAVQHGLKSLQEDALRQVIEGVTSIQEVLRVCK
jgi:general secretion pathway protein E